MKFVRTTTVYRAVILVAFSFTAEAREGSTVSAAFCPELVADIEIALIAKTSPTTGRVRITGIVKNLGSVAWIATTSSHRLQMILAQKISETKPNGIAVQPVIEIAQLGPGQQYRIDHQLNWDANTTSSYPKFILRFAETGRVGTAAPRSNCRSRNRRKEISAAEINKLFIAPPSPIMTQPLKVQSYRLLGGVGINTVEATLVYRKTSAAAGKLSASVAAPYSGTSDEMPIIGNNGTVKMRINIPCEFKDPANLAPQPVTITYRLWGAFSLPGASSWVAGFSTQQAIAYNELCVAHP